MMPDKPLFIPLKRKFFEQFERGEKTVEVRRLGPRWNTLTCRPGRAVVLSLGYGKAHRLRGVVKWAAVYANAHYSKEWKDCYGDAEGWAVCFGIALDKEPSA